MVYRSSLSPSAVRGAKAREAVGKYLNVQWTDAEVGPCEGTFGGRREGLQAVLRTLPILTNGCPSLVFVVTDKTKPLPKLATAPTASPKKPPTPEPSAQAKDSADAWAELFQKVGDYSVFIPGRFFNIVRIDTTEVDEKTNKYICSERAPMVILTRKNGDIQELYESKAKIKGSAIAAAMSDILQKDGYIQRAVLFVQLNALMVDLEKAEIGLLAAKDELAKREEKLKAEEKKDEEKKQKKGKKAAEEHKTSSAVLLAQKAVEEFAPKVKEKEAARYEVLMKDYAMLKELGMPDSKLPAQPVPPGSAQSAKPAKPAPPDTTVPSATK